MSVTYESPSRYMSDFSDNESCASNASTPNNRNPPPTNPNSNTAIHQEFMNVIQARQMNHQLQTASTGWSRNNIPSSYRHQHIEDLQPIESDLVNNLMVSDQHVLIIDVRAHSFFCENRIHFAVNISLPSVLLKRPAYTMDKVSDSITYDDKAADSMRRWNDAANIIFYDHSSNQPSESGNSATAILLGAKLRTAGYKGQLNYLQGEYISMTHLSLLYSLTHINPI